MLSDTTDFCRLVLLRHPELDPSFSNLAVGGGDASIGRRGQAQILGWLDTLQKIPLSSIHCAEQSQCMDPARALAAKLQVDIQEDARLNDQNMGTWQGRSWDEIVQDEGEAVQGFFAEFGEAKAPEGESLGQAVERMLEWWNTVAQSALGKTVAVITSGAMISGFATAMLGIRLSRCVSLNLPHAGLGILDCYANGARMTTWNPTALDL